MSAAKLVGGTLAGLGGFWAVAQLTALGVSRGSPRKENVEFPSEQERKDLFSNLAPKWDSTVRWDEFTSGINRWRRQLAERAEGDVLEVAIGTGRNLEYYNEKRVRSVTGIDFSRKMLEIILSKKESGNLNPNIPMKLRVGNCSDLSDFKDSEFDTVVDTFGICSFEDPVSALKEMRRVCKPTGQILLLEHGESDWPYMQRLLTNQVGVHVNKFGCYNHRSIESLIKEAGLTVVSEKRKHWGTIYFYVCSPNKESHNTVDS
jgi:methyltransferase OMS1